MFTRSESTWSQEARIEAATDNGTTFLGKSLDLEGDALLAGGPRDNNNAFRAGAGFLFKRTGTTWNQTEMLLTSDGTNDDELGGAFGTALSAETGIFNSLDDAAYVFNLAGPAADLLFAKTGPASVNPSADFTYTLTVTNNGPDTADNISVTDSIPGNVSLVSVGSGCNVVVATVTCTAASLANGVNVPFTITVTAPSAGGSISSIAPLPTTLAAPPPTPPHRVPC